MTQGSGFLYFPTVGRAYPGNGEADPETTLLIPVFVQSS